MNLAMILLLDKENEHVKEQRLEPWSFKTHTISRLYLHPKLPLVPVIYIARYAVLHYATDFTSTRLNDPQWRPEMFAECRYFTFRYTWHNKHYRNAPQKFDTTRGRSAPTGCAAEVTYGSYVRRTVFFTSFLLQVKPRKHPLAHARAHASPLTGFS